MLRFFCVSVRILEILQENEQDVTHAPELARRQKTGCWFNHPIIPSHCGLVQEGCRTDQNLSPETIQREGDDLFGRMGVDGC